MATEMTTVTATAATATATATPRGVEGKIDDNDNDDGDVGPDVCRARRCRTSRSRKRRCCHRRRRRPSSSIAPFHKTRDGQGALNALKSQHAGKAVYDRLVKEAEQMLFNKVWNGNTPTSLASHMGAQRKAWISMQECADHVPVDVPNEQA